MNDHRIIGISVQLLNDPASFIDQQFRYQYLGIEIIKKNNENVVADDGSEHIVAHAEFSQSGKEHQIGHKKETCPCYHVSEYCYEFLAVLQNLVEVLVNN